MEGAAIIDELNGDGNVVAMFSEGVLEHFFSEHIKTYEKEDMEWYIITLSKPDDISGSEISHTVLNQGVAKFYLRRILTIKSSCSPDNILCLFEDEVYKSLFVTTEY